MEVEFTVDVVHGKAPSMPRVESPTHLMVLGQAGSLDDALRAATSGMTQWLEQDYGLSLSESAQVLGSSVQYVVANLAGRSVGVAAKLTRRGSRTSVPRRSELYSRVRSKAPEKGAEMPVSIPRPLVRRGDEPSRSPGSTVFHSNRSLPWPGKIAVAAFDLATVVPGRFRRHPPGPLPHRAQRARGRAPGHRLLADQ